MEEYVAERLAHRQVLVDYILLVDWGRWTRCRGHSRLCGGGGAGDREREGDGLGGEGQAAPREELLQDTTPITDSHRRRDTDSDRPDSESDRPGTDSDRRRGTDSDRGRDGALRRLEWRELRRRRRATALVARWTREWQLSLARVAALSRESGSSPGSDASRLYSPGA